MNIRSNWTLLLALPGLLISGLSEATSFYPQPFPTTVQDAPVIVRGKAGRSYSDWSSDTTGGKKIYTYFELEVSEVLKGSANRPSLLMREMGGEKDGVGLHIPGTSSYNAGEEVVVLLKDKNPDGTYDVQGMMMGKYDVQTDSEGKDYLTGPGLNDESIQHDENTQPNNPAKKWYLDDLRELIRTQRESASTDSQKGQNLQPVSNPHPSPSPAALENRSNPSAAPQLQSSPSEEPDTHSSFYILSVGLGVLVVLGLLFKLLGVMRRKK